MFHVENNRCGVPVDVRKQVTEICADDTRKRVVVAQQSTQLTSCLVIGARTLVYWQNAKEAYRESGRWPNRCQQQ
jgi:hypothetical protein